MTVATPMSSVGNAVRVQEVPDPQVPERAKRRRDTAKYKGAIRAEYDSLDCGGWGALMRRGGSWLRARAAAQARAAATAAGTRRDTERVAMLEVLHSEPFRMPPR